jgi:hypothetical protein
MKPLTPYFKIPRCSGKLGTNFEEWLCCKRKEFKEGYQVVGVNSQHTLLGGLIFPPPLPLPEIILSLFFSTTIHRKSCSKIKTRIWRVFVACCGYKALDVAMLAFSSFVDTLGCGGRKGIGWRRQIKTSDVDAVNLRSWRRGHR